MRVKITDVATHAGVSIATVSHVINGTRFVREETAQRVRQAIADLHYVPDNAARGFKRGNRSMIGFLVPDIANAFFATIIDSIERELSQKGYRLLVVNTCESKAVEADALTALSAGIVDGLIIASTFDRCEDVFSHLSPGFPVVFVDRNLENCTTDMVIASSYRAVYESIQALIQKGHKKIGFLGSIPSLSTSSERLRGYRQALQDSGISSCRAYERNITSLADNEESLVRELLREGCTALFISNSRMCIKVLNVLHLFSEESGKKLELVSFCDSPDYRSFFARMDIVEQPTQELGTIAGKRILERIAHPSLPPRETVLYSVFKYNKG